MKLTLNLYQPLPNVGALDTADTLVVDTDVTQLQYTTALPGGFQALSIGLRDRRRPQFSYLPRDIGRRGFAHLVLTAGSATVWEGRVMQQRLIGGEVRGLTAKGYGLTATTDNWYGSSGGSGTTAGTVLLDVLRQAAGLLHVGSDFNDSGIAHVPADFDGMAPNQVIDQLSKEGGGGSSNALMDWAVWENRTASFMPRLATPQPTYVIPWEGPPDTVEQDEDYDPVYGSVSVRYTPSGGTVTTTAAKVNPDFLGLYGVSRSQLVQGSTLSAAAATQLRDTIATLAAAPALATTITRTRGRGMERPGGAEQAPWLVRAGEWVQIGAEPPLIITQTSFDANAKTLRLTAQSAPKRYLNQILQLLSIAAHTLNRTNAISGAPL